MPLCRDVTDRRGHLTSFAMSRHEKWSANSALSHSQAASPNSPLARLHNSSTYTQSRDLRFKHKCLPKVPPTSPKVLSTGSCSSNRIIGYVPPITQTTHSGDLATAYVPRRQEMEVTIPNMELESSVWSEETVT
jgi:hypothetical protein